jgi:hypothetical protein
MKFDEALEKLIEEGAIRVYPLSRSLAYAYRLRDSVYQARSLHAVEDEWSLGKRLVSAKDLESLDGWFDIPALPWQATAIQSDAAKKNEGYGYAIWQQCHTCKEVKPEKAFERDGQNALIRRNWECNECYERRMREMTIYRNKSTGRSGDYLDRETVASPPPAEGEI